MKIKELISQLQNFPPDTAVAFYVGKGGVGRPVQQVYFHPSGFEDSPMVVLMDELTRPELENTTDPNGNRGE